MSPRTLITRLTTKRHDNSAEPISAMPPASTGWLVPLLVTAVLIAAIWSSFLPLVHQGGLSHTDEFLTLDRSGSFSRHETWFTVFNNNAPGFKKPPLQYWMSGLLLEADLDLEVAMRAPSMVFALGVLIATAWLTAVLAPGCPWAVPAAVLLCASSLQLWIYATSAMLETGVALFATLALIATILALRRPIWWYGMALSVGFGALQKAPIALVFVLLFVLILHLTRGLHGFSYAKLKENPHFLRAFRLALAAVIFWPFLQLVLHGEEDAIKEFMGSQMVERFSPLPTEHGQRATRNLWDLIIAGEPLVRGFGILALLWLPWRLKRPELLPLAGIVIVFVLAIGFAGGRVYDRYSLVLVPLLAASLAAALVILFRQPWYGLAATVVIAVASGGPVYNAEQLRLDQDPRRGMQIEALTRLGQALDPGETLVVCNWSTERIPSGAISYFAAVNGRRLKTCAATPATFAAWPAAFLLGRSPDPVRGMCRPEHLRELSDVLDGIASYDGHGGYLLWTASAAPPE